MSFDSHKNFAIGAVGAGSTVVGSAVGTGLNAVLGASVVLPTPPFNIVVYPTGGRPTGATAEIMRVTANTGGALTVTRAQESTSALTSIAVGHEFIAGITAKTITDIETLLTAGGISISNPGTGTGLSVQSTGDGSGLGAQGLFVKSWAGDDVANTNVHALTAYLTGTGNTNASALNVVSDNTAMSAMQLSGKETNRGTLKISHTGTGGDSGAAALSIDLKGAGTAAQGIFIDSTGGGTTGNLIYIRNNGVDVLKITADAAGVANATGVYNGQLKVQKAGTSGTGSTTLNATATITSPEGATSGDNAAALKVDLTGSGNSGASSSALKVTSANASQSAMQLAGVETGTGTLKITHTATGGDSSAEGLQITLAGTGTAARGIFVDTSGGGTTGALIYLRNNGNDILKITPKAADFTTAVATFNAQGRFVDGVGTLVVAGAVSDGSFSNGGVNGLLAIDSTNFDEYKRIGGNWYKRDVSDPAWTPKDHGLIAWTGAPDDRSGAFALVAGTQYLGAFKLNYPQTLATIHVNVSTAGTGATALSGCYVGIVDPSGNVIGASSDQAGNWNTTGDKAVSITGYNGHSLATPAAGIYRVIVLIAQQSTTACQLSTNSTQPSMVNCGLSAANLRGMTNGTLKTVLDTATITLSGGTSANLIFSGVA